MTAPGATWRDRLRRLDWRDRGLRAIVGLACVLALTPLATLRFDAVKAITTHDAAPGAAPRLPRAAGVGVTPTPQLRVVLIDGAGASTARTMPAWDALCARGLDLQIDVGFPTVSLPVELALWTGRTQQQTGVLYHATGTPVPPPADGIPAAVPGSIAIAESHPYIVHSLGFARTLPPTPSKELPPGWATQWVTEARAAVAGPARLVFVHVLRVDTTGHKRGKVSAAWREAAAGADAILGELIAAAPAARWLVLADHDHIATGGHGGEDRAIRIVRGCLAGPDIAVGRGGPISVVDVARAIADSVGVALPADSAARPLHAALAAPVSDADVLPPLPRGRVALALVVVLLGIAATAWGARGRLLAAPWWWPAALIALMVLATTPSLSTPMIYKREGLIMRDAFAPALIVLVLLMAVEVHRDWRRALVAQLALPVAAALALWIVTGATGLWFGEPVCPVVPRWTGWLPPVTLIAATGLAVAGLVVLASAVLPGSGPSARSGTSRSDRAGP
ncbi:MAG: hypothetical protein IPL61_04150 [Myxococcales bacterium]|nr:hypothetical protein [Myxococcales bacterium]